MTPIRSLALVLFLGACLLTLAFVSGCASMSESECLTASWQDQGYRDGLQGLTISRVADHHKACREYGVVPDAPAYRAGHAEGVLAYCTPERSMSEGRAGKPYRKVCPPQIEPAFLHPYRAGQRVYGAEQEVSRLDAEAERLQRKLDEGGDRAERRKLREELRDLDGRLKNAREELRHAEQRARQIY